VFSRPCRNGYGNAAPFVPLCRLVAVAYVLGGRIQTWTGVDVNQRTTVSCDAILQYYEYIYRKFALAFRARIQEQNPEAQRPHKPFFLSSFGSRLPPYTFPMNESARHMAVVVIQLLLVTVLVLSILIPTSLI
jgi:hypothetical protein